MKKNAILKLLSVIVGVMVIVASVVCLTTVNAADDFGTDADGITTTSKTAMDSWTATEGLKNGDFTEGLKYWGPGNYGSTTEPMKTSNIANLKTEGTNKYAQFNGALPSTNAAIQTVPVKVSATKVAAGDKLAVMYKGDAAPDDANSKVSLWQFNVAEGKKGIVGTTPANITVYKAVDSTWAILTSQEGTVLANATASDYYTFAVEFRATKKAAAARFDDVKIVKVKADGFYTLDGLKIDENGNPVPGSGGGEGGAGGSTPEPKDEDYILGGVTSLLPGTEEAGITNPTNAGQYSTSANGIHGTVILGLPNGDFEQGFKWWAGKQNCDIRNSAKLVKDGENTYIQFNNLDKEYEGFCAPDVGVHTDDLKEGDQLVVIFDHKGANFQIVFGQRNASGAQENRNISQIIKTGDWTTSYIALGGDGKVRARTAGASAGYADSDYYAFKFVVENKKTDSDGAFDNFRLAIKDGNKFYDLDGNEITFTTGGGDGGEGGEGGDDSASDYEKVLMDNGANMPGTEAEGITGKSGNLHASAVLGLNNGDFQKGFKWWAGKQAGGPSTVMDLKTEGENKYVQFNINKLDAQWRGLASPDIAIPEQYVKSGDTLAFIYDFKGTDFQVVFAQRNGGTGGRMAEGNSRNSTELAVNGEWTTAVAPIKNTVGDRSAGNLVGCEGTGYYAFYIYIENSGTACDAAFDNIRLAKVGADGGYYDIYTGEKMVFKSTPAGGEGGNGGSGSTGTGNGNGSGTNGGSSATTGETLPVMPMAVAGIVLAASAVILRKKVR